MGNIANYQLKLLDQDGNFLYFLDRFLSLQLTRTKNDIGTLNVVLPEKLYKVTDFQKDYRLEVWRNGTLVGQTCWFLLSAQKELTNRGKEVEITLTFADTIELISRRVNANFASQTPITAGHLQGAGDDLIKVLAQYAFGNLVGADGANVPDTPFLVNPNGNPPPVVPLLYLNNAERQFPIDIAGYQGRASVIVHLSSFLDLLAAFQEIADAIYVTEDLAQTEDFYNNLWFDVLYTPATLTSISMFELRTWVGIRNNDLRNIVNVGPDYGNLNSAIYLDDWTNRAEIAYVLGDGDNNAQIIGGFNTSRSSDSYYYSLPFGPVETTTAFSQNSAAVAQADLEDAGAVELGSRNNTKSITGNIITTPNFQFTLNFNYGDIMLLTWDDVSEVVEISAFTISVDGAEETISIPLSILEEI